ncbi:MAG: amidohydrolase family protein [Nitrospiraceae bacterium]|nr:amidohydrolase family protein [Nitrospiraceae bacterium]
MPHNVRKQTLLIKDISYLVRDAYRVEHDVDVLIEGNRIVRMGRVTPREITSGTVVIEGAGKIVTPGFVNAHTHLYQSMLKGRRDDVPLVSWCDEVTFPFVRNVLQRVREERSNEIGYLWSMLGTMEMIRSGITTFIDMDMNLPGVPQAWVNIGIRGIAAMSMVDQWVPDDFITTTEQLREEILKLIEDWHQIPAEDPLVQVFLGPSAPFTCSEGLLTWIMDVAEKNDLGIQTHVSETEWEVQHSLETVGKTPLFYLDSIGFLSRPILAVHGVHLTDEEIELAKKSSVTVVYNPKSNMKLGSGIAPIAKMRRVGVNVAMGTDGAASNDLLDPFEEMRAGVLLQKVAAMDPTALDARDIFASATAVGAAACRVDAGTIDEGRLADLVVIDPSAPHMFNLGDDIVPALVYCAKGGDVETVIINGRVVMRDRTIMTIDEKVILKEAKRVGASYG